MLELKSQRGYKKQVFINDEGRTEIRLFAGDVYYNNKLGVGDGVQGFRGIENKLVWNEQKRGWEFFYHNYNPFIPEYADQQFTYRDLFQGKDQTSGFRPVANHVQGRLVERLDGVTEQNAVIYDDAFGEGIDLIIAFTYKKMLKIVRIREAYKPTEAISFDFELTFPNLGAYVADSAKGQLTAVDWGGATKSDTREVLFGNDQKDGRDWYTRLGSFRAWDSGVRGENTGQKVEITPVSFLMANGKHVLRKTITQAFLASSVGDVFTDATVNYFEDKDTYYGTAFTTGGAPNHVNLAVGGWGDTYYSYLEWDLTGSPTVDQVSDVKASIKVSGVAVNDSGSAWWRVTSSWTEAGVTSTVKPTDTSSGAVAITNPVTTGAGNRDEKSILAFYQGWKNGTFSNFGLKINSTTNPTNAQHNFHSSDAVDSNNFPYLVITLVDQAYTRANKASLPTNADPLDTTYSTQDKSDVQFDDATRVAVSGFNNLIHLYKYRHTNNTDPINLTWNGQASIAPTSKTVKLQIYNFVTPGWEDVQTNSAAAANTDFTLTGTITTDLSEYYDDNNYVYARVYQDVT